MKSDIQWASRELTKSEIYVCQKRALSGPNIETFASEHSAEKLLCTTAAIYKVNNEFIGKEYVVAYVECTNENGEVMFFSTSSKSFIDDIREAFEMLDETWFFMIRAVKSKNYSGYFYKADVLL